MVEKDGEKKTRSSKSRRPRLPKSYRLQKKVPESTSKPSNKFKKFNCESFNCTTEKLSSLLMCQKGYASFAFYAVFIVFILAFIYVLWKIVGANTSRSGQSRRPEASPKVSPTTIAPTWSEEDEEELKKFFPTTASFVSTNIGTREKIDPTSSPLNSPEPSSIPLRDTNLPTRETTRPTQSQISQLGTYLPSLPRLLRGSVFGEDAVTPFYGRSRQNAVVGEDFTPFPATSPLTSRWPSMASTTWKAKLQEQQPPWQFNRRRQMPFAYQRGNPLQSLIRNSELSDKFYSDRGQYSKENKQSMKSSFDTTKRMSTLQREGEEVKSAWAEEGENLHTAKKHEDEQKKRHHRSHTRKHQHHHRHKSSNEESWIDADSEKTSLNDETKSHEQDTLLPTKHHHLKYVGDRRGEDFTIDENYLRDAESDDGNDRSVIQRHHHHLRGSHERHHEPDRHQTSEQREDADDDNNNSNYHTHQHHHTHDRHQLNSQQQNQDGDQEEKEEHRVHHHHTHHHHHHHAHVQQQSKKHYHHKSDLIEADSETYREHRHKRVHHHSVLNTQHAKRTKIIHHLTRHHLHRRHPHHRPQLHHNLHSPSFPPPSHRHHHHHHHNHQQHHQHRHKQKCHHHHHHHHQHFYEIKNHKPDSTHQSRKHTPTKNPSLKHFHHILDYKHYLRFKQSHTLEEEVHGNWKNIKKQAKRCINIRTFSANGKVRLTRTRYRAKYLYTVLVCKVVQVRKRGGGQKSDSEYKTAQLCHKLYFITKGVVRLILNKPSKGRSSSSEYKVEACRPSKDVHFQAMSFQGAFTHDDRSQRSDIPKHKHEAIEVHKKSKKGKLPHKLKGHKHTKHDRAIKHGTKGTRHHPKRAKHSKKHKKKKLNTKKRVSRKHSNNSKKDTKDKTQEDVFFGKLLNILTIASGNNKASNSSNNPLTKLKGALQKMKKAKEEMAKHLKKKHKTPSMGKKKHSKETKLPDVSSPKYIKKLLEKILPSVVSNVKADLQGRKGEMLVKNAYVSTTTTVKPTTTPSPTTKPTTTPSTTATTTSTTTSTTTATTTATATFTTTTKPTTKPTTKSNDLEDELKDILPLLLKKAQLAKKTTTTQKPTTSPTTKPTTLSKTKQIKDLLARLNLGGIDLGGLADPKPTSEVRATANVVHTTVQQRLDELDGLPEAQPRTLQNDMDLNQISNSGGPVSVLGNDPFAKNILCFGDSLTKGYYHRGQSSHPYSIQLARLLNANSQTRYNLVTSGKNGEMTHGSMIKRLPEVLGNSSHFDWVIILAGTNDVAHVKNFGDDDSFMNQLVNVWSPKIFQDIISLHESAYKYGSRTVLLTIPESAYEAWPQFRTLWVMRKKINQELREFASRSQGRTILCDLAMKLPRHSLSPQMQKALWSDHLHFTPYGYDKMAGVIYQCMKPYL